MWPVSQRFLDELKKPIHTVAARVDFLDTDFMPVKSIAGYNGAEPNDVLIDGAVDVDVDRGTRRTLTMSLLNPGGEFTASGDAFTQQTDWDGFFYVNRLIRLWRGVRYHDGTEELAPVGTFMVDKSETLVERSMSTVVIAGSDLWKKFAKSQFGTPTTFTDGTAINSIIETMASSAGVTLLSLDPLTGRTAASKNIQRDITFEADETRGEALLKICGHYGVEIFFDPMGVLRTRDFQNPYDRPTIWFYDEQDDLTFFMRSVIDDERLYNHTVVTGTGDAEIGGTIYKAELKDNDPGSPTNITRLGDRVFRFSSSLLASQESVDKAVYTIFYRHFLINNRIAMEAVCNPAIEGNDVVWIAENKFSKIDGRFLLNTFSIPLVTSKQKLSMKRVLDIRPSS